MLRTFKGKRPIIKPLVQGFTEPQIGAFDTETYIDKEGLCNIFSIQFTGDNFSPSLYYVDNKTALAQFVAIVDFWSKKERVNVIFAHNLEYDLTALLLNYPDFLDLLTNKGHVKISWSEATLEIFAGKIWFAKIRYGSHRVIHLIDSFRFTFASLDNTAKMFGLSENKLAKPEYLGEKLLKSQEFENYAIQDSVVTYEIAKRIIDIHREFDVSITVSSAQLSAKIFKKHYLENPIPVVPIDIEELCIASYHGGITRAIAGYYDNLIEYDITSAYPEAMVNLGIPESYIYLNDFSEENLNAVYQCILEGSYNEKYPILFSDNFKPVNNNNIFCCTGYELLQAKAIGQKVKVLRGTLCKFSGSKSLSTFVQDFYRKKATAKSEGNKIKEHFYKRILNSLYGKFIQSISEGEKEYKPSGLWNPFLATLITGFVRAKLHKLEVASNSVHSATDSLKTTSILPTDNELGGLKKEVEGACLVVRGKVYAHEDRATGKFKLATHGVGSKTQKESWLHMLNNESITRKRVVSLKTAKIRSLHHLTWIDVSTNLKDTIPCAPKDFIDKLKEYCYHVT